MKRSLLAIATGSMALFPIATTADTGPTVYGKANISYENQDNGNDERWALESNASRLGVKGSLDLDMEALEAIYQAEFEVSFDDGDSGGEVFSQRNIFGGFRHQQFGTLRAGRFDTPLKVSQGKVDQLGDLADIKGVMAGENRVDNIVQYSSPAIGENLTLNAALIPGEEQGGENDGPADAVSSSVVFDNGLVYGALAYDSEVQDTLIADGTVASPASGQTRLNILRATGQVRIADIELGGIVQQAEDTEGDGEDMTYFISAGYSINRLKLKAQYGMTDADQLDNDVTLIGVGADYRVGDGSKVFAYLQDLEPDNPPTNPTFNGLQQEDTTVGVGFEHKFSMN